MGKFFFLSDRNREGQQIFGGALAVSYQRAGEASRRAVEEIPSTCVR